MPAYIREITRWACHDCPKKATVEVYNDVNSLVGRYCWPHGNAKVKQLNERRT